MSAPDTRTRPGRRAIAAATALLCALAAAGPAGASSDPAGTSTDGADRVTQADSVREAEQRLEEAEQRLDEARDLAAGLSARLDAAAGHFEHARAHRLRLEDEEGDLAGQAERAAQRAGRAEADFARQVAGTYKRPGAEIALAEAIVLAPDPNTAMHRAALLERLTARERMRADRAHDEAALAGDVERQHRVVRAGVHAAAEDSRRKAEDLQLQLGFASRQVEQASASLTDAETERDRAVAAEQRRLEQERRAEEAARRAAELAARGSGPLPPVDGKVCPIGAPNAFIDSWGFPRSGGRRHQGVDIFAEYGMPLYAVADGLVRRVWNNRLGGLSVDLLDDRGDRYYYAHLSAVSVSPGQRVRAGEVVGANGNSGNARGTPPHLHWQYHPGDGRPVNPYPLARALCRA